MSDGSTLDSPYRGYGGWLALFCAAQLFIAPIFVVILEIIEAHTFWELGTLLAGEQNIGYGPAFSAVAARYPGLMAAYVLESLGAITVVGLGMYAAIRLRGIRPGAVRSANCYMLAALAWSVIAFALPFIGKFPDGGQEAMIRALQEGFVRTLIPFVIWFTYFNVSKRVKATYVEG